MAAFKELAPSQTKLTAALVLASVAALATVPAPVYAGWWTKGLTDFHEEGGVAQFSWENRLFLSRVNFNAAAQLASPVGLNSYLRAFSEVAFTYGVSNRFSFTLRGNWSLINVEAVPSGASVFGFADQTAAVNVRVIRVPVTSGKMRAFALDLQLQGDLPAYDLAAMQAAAVPFLGDGSVDLTLAAFASLPIAQDAAGAFMAQAGGGFTYRTAGFASHFPWSAALTYERRSDGLLAGLGGYGIVSLLNDTQANPVTGIRVPQGSSGSFFTYATNPVFITATGYAGYLFKGGFAITASGAYSLWGFNAPSGFTGTLALKLRLGDTANRDVRELTPVEYGKSNQGLVYYHTEAKVLRVVDRMNLVKIDKGSQDGVEVGQIFDVFRVNKAGSAGSGGSYDGSSGEAIARTKVISVLPNEAALSVEEYFKEGWIDEGFIVRKLLR